MTLIFNTKISSALLFALYIGLITPPCAVAATADEIEQIDEDPATDNDPGEFDVAAPIEIGPGGSIKRESPYRTQAESDMPVHFHAMWESRYITEGRDNLSDDSLVSVSTDISYGNFTFAPWIADSPGNDYSELNLNLVYGIDLSESFELYTTYTHLRSDTDGVTANDNEVGVELGYIGFIYLDVIASWYHSLDAEGSYFELALRHENTSIKNITLSAGLITGINDGYVAAGHNGVDHIQARAGLAYHPWKQLEVFAYLSYSQAINRDAIKYADDAGLDDYSWGGVGTTYRF